MSHKIVEIIYDITKKCRVRVFRRDDGTFGFWEEHYSDDQYEQCWIPQLRSTESFFDTLETALREVHGRVTWLKATNSEA